MAYLLGWKCIGIELYPYGGCSNFDVDVNVSLHQELLVLIMGPIMQIVFIALIGNFVDSKDFILFERYSNWILMFNLLPIYPLDGGKLLNIILGIFLSFYRSYQITLCVSYFLFVAIFMIVSFLKFNLVLVLIFGLLGFNLIKEIKRSSFYYHRFLLERYLNKYDFRRSKKINNLKQMKRDTIHTILNIPEKEYFIRHFVNVK